MTSAWGDSWGGAWGDAWGETATDPNALRGIAHGSSTAQAVPGAIVWLAGSSAGSSTAQAYLELDGGTVAPAPTFGGAVRARRGSPKAREQVLRGELLANGETRFDLAAVRELVRSVSAVGSASVRVEPVRELVRGFEAAGGSMVAVTARREIVPVFDADELMALAAWQMRYRH